MPYTVALPDGRIVEFPDSVPKERAAEILRKQFPAPEAPSAGFSVRDILTSFGQGAVGSTKALTDVAGAENVASQALERAGESLQQRLSPARQAELRRQQERAKKAEESGSTYEEIKAAAQSVAEAPLQSAAQALGSFVPYLPTMFLGPAAAALGLGARATAAATTVAKAAPAAIGTAQGAGAVKGAIYERVYEAERQDGVPEEQARAKAGAAQEYFGKNVDQILLGAGAGYVAGRFGAERLLTPGAAAAAERSALGRIGTAVATDVPTEAFQGGQERLAANLALQREGRNVPTFQGVAGQAAQEGIMGALGAVPVAAIRGPGDVSVKEEQDRRAEEAARRQTEADAEAARQAAFRQTPEYIDELEKRFAQVKTTEEALKAAIPKKVDKNDPLAVEESRRAKAALKEFQESDEYTKTLQEYTEAFDVLRPRILERQRAERVQAAPEGAQLDVFGEPAGVQDMSVPGQIRSLNTYITSFDKQIKDAEKAGDQQQVALFKQKQEEARGQIATLLPQPALLVETKTRAQQRLEDYQTQINELASQEELTTDQYQQLRNLDATANQLRKAITEIESTQKIVERYTPTEVVKPIDKEKKLTELRKKLAKQSELGEPISQTLDQIAELEAVQEQPALFGEEDLREIKPRDLGDVIADERKKIKDLQNMALMFAEQARQAQAQRGVVRSTKQELLEEARQINLQLRQRNQDLVDLEQLQLMESRLTGQLLGLQSQNKPIPEQLTKRIKAVRKDIDGLIAKLKAQEPVREGQRELLPAAEEGELAARVTDEELTAQRDRDIEALLDQYLAPALGVTETQETLALQGPEGERQIRLTTLGGENYAALRQELENVNQRRDDAVVELFDSKGATADALRSEIVMLATREVEITRAMNKLAPLSDEYRQDLQRLVQDSFQRRSAVQKGPPNLAEQRYLAAQADFRAVEDETLDAIYEMRKLEYQLRSKGLPEVARRSWSFLEGEGPETARPGSTAELIQENPVIQKGMAAQRRLSAAQRRVDELAKAMPELPDLTQKSLDDKLDGLVSEFAEGSPQELEQISKARRVAMGQRPAALPGADIGERIAANDAQIKQIRQDLKYAGRPTDPEKVAARDKLVAELKPLLTETAALRAQYNKQQAGQAAPAAPEETGEVAEMRQELAKIERTLAEGTFKDSTSVNKAGLTVTQQLEAARDELRGRIEAATGPARPAAKAEAPLLPGMAQRFAQFEYRPVTPEMLLKAETAYLNATQKIEDIRKALSRLDEMGPQYFQEVATTYQQNIDSNTAARTRINKKITALEERLKEVAAARDRVVASNRSETEKSDLLDEAREQLDDTAAQIKDAKEELEIFDRRSKDLEQAQTEVTTFLNLAKLAGVGKGRNLRDSLEKARDVALADKDKKEAAVKDLQQRQRMYEQQEAAKRGVELGDIEAERITSGEAKGFVSGRGKALAEKPKSKRSWVISQDSKAAVPTPNAAGKLEAATQNAFNLLAQAKKETAAATEALEGAPTPESLAPIKNALTVLEGQINAYYTPDQAAEITKEVTLLQEKLAAIATAPKIADVASAYDRAVRIGASLPANSPKSAPMRVAQMMVDATVKETKAGNALKAAEKAVADAEQKFNTTVTNVKKAEKKLEKLKDPAKIRGTKLYIDNVYGSAQALRDAIADAQTNLTGVETKYMAARLERLLLVQQMGEHAKTEAANLTARLTGAADTVTALTKERDAALEREAKIRGKLTAAELAAETAEEAAKAAQNAERTAKRVAEEKAKQDAIAAAAAARSRADSIRAGLGLPGIRVERATAGTVGTALQADIKKRLATAETELGKAIKSGDTAAITAATKTVEDTATELDQVFAKAPTTVTEVGREAEQRQKETEDAFAPAPVAGVRAAPRKEGPAVRYVRGGSKAIMQAGVTKLRAEGLSQEAANAISLYVAKSKIAGGKTAAEKEKLTKSFAALTVGMTDEQVKGMVDEGKRLMGLGPTAELIAKRSAYQNALAAVAAAQTEFNRAKTAVTKELAEDALVLAQQRENAAEISYNLAKDRYEMSMVKTAKKAQKETIESFFDEAEAVAPSKLSSAVGDDLVPMVYTTATRTESNPAVREAIQDGRLLEALDRLAVEGANELIRQSARELRPLVMRTKVRMDPNLKAEGKDVPAAFNPAENTIFFRPTEITDEDIIHEVTHAATLRVLRMPESELTPRQLAAKREIQAIFAKMERETSLAGQYGLENIEEFVSEVQSNVEFRAAIDKQPWYKRLWHAIVRLFSNAPIETISDRASQLVRELYLPSRKIEKAAENVPSIFRGEAAPSSIMGRPAGTLKTLQGNLFGLAGRVQYIDRLAAPEKAFVEAQKTGALSSLEAENAQYFMRLGDMTTQAAGQFITTGPVKIVKDNFNGRVEERYASESGPTLVSMAEFMERASKEGLGDANEVERIVTVKVAGDRANAIPRGWERLMSTDPDKAKTEYNEVMAKLNANPAAKKFIDAAIAEYKAYNDGLMDFAEQTGYITADEAKRLKKTPYVPYYRVENGVVKLFVDRETAMVIGNIKDNPDLQQLLGDNKQILPILTSAVQNTFMLTRMGLRNKATQETAKALEKAGFVTKMGKGPGLANVNTVHYKYRGEPYFATIDADQFGIPAELIVKGMEGIKTTIPDVVRLMGLPANWLRTFITRLPAYALRQMVRDPLNAAIVGGVDGFPVLNALKQMAKMRAGRNPSADALMRGLVVSSNIYSGNEQDMQRFIEAASTGRGKWTKLMGGLDQLALQSDAATRTAIYEDGIKKGLSERQAQFRAMESQNFSRRGLSSSMQMLSTLVPFFNAQVQGLDALYRSFKGDMPFSQKLDIQKKILTRGALLMVTALSYAFLMRDNEEYKKATPEERYANFFVPLPGTKDMLKIPIPYEVGLLFKALPEAILDSILGDTKAEEASKGIGKLLLQSAPGVVPAAAKPLLEAAYGQTLLGPIESQREKQLPAAQRVRETTPEALKTLGSFTGELGISPLMLEHLARGYTSSLGISMLRMLDPVLGSATEGEKATESLTKTPFVGGLFQTGDGRFLIERAYSRMEEITQAVQGYEDLEKRGKRAEAQAFAQRNADLLAASDMAGMFRQRSGQMFADERAIRAEPSLTRAQKDALLEKLKAAQQEEARQFYKASERTKPQ